MLRILPFIVFIFSVFVMHAQKPKTPHYVRRYDYVVKQDFTGYDSILQSEVRYDRKGRPVEHRNFLNGKLYNGGFVTFDAEDRRIGSV